MWRGSAFPPFCLNSIPPPSRFPFNSISSPHLLTSHLAALGQLCVSGASELQRPLSSVLCEPQSSALLKIDEPGTQRTFRLGAGAKTCLNVRTM